jgi:hypothetical protein
MDKERSDETMTEYLEGVCIRNCKGLNVPCTKECAIPVKERSDEIKEKIKEVESELRREAVNKIAAELLPILLANLEKAGENKDLLKLYEVDFLGDLYARMIVSVYMGYYPSRMADDAEDAAHRLYEMTKEHDNE